MDVNRKMRICIILFILLSFVGIILAIYPLLAPVRSGFARTFTSSKWYDLAINNRISTVRGLVISSITFGIFFGAISLIVSAIFLVGQYKIVLISEKWWFILIASTIIAFTLGVIATSLTTKFIHNTIWVLQNLHGYQQEARFY